MGSPPHRTVQSRSADLGDRMERQVRKKLVLVGSTAVHLWTVFSTPSPVNYYNTAFGRDGAEPVHKHAYTAY